MFVQKELDEIDRRYFHIIRLMEMDVVLQSRNTKHCWHIHCIEPGRSEACVIFHRHENKMDFHRHGQGISLKQALRQIREHDTWQLKGRPKRRKTD